MIAGWKAHYRNEPEISGTFDQYKITFNLKTRKVRDGIKDGINTVQLKILKEINTDRHSTSAKLSRSIKISIRNIEKNLAKLREKGLIKRVGSRKSGHWEV